MANKSETVGIGPVIPRVPYKDFKKVDFSHDDLFQIWQVIGPTIKVNLDRQLPLWQVLVIAYIQGLENGFGIAEEKGKKMVDVNIKLSKGDVEEIVLDHVKKKLNLGVLKKAHLSWTDGGGIVFSLTDTEPSMKYFSDDN